jgi:uncharacterized protein (DUF2062 family)
MAPRRAPKGLVRRRLEKAALSPTFRLLKRQRNAIYYLRQTSPADATGMAMGKRLTLKERLRGIIHINDTPHKVAASFAVGVFFGMSPFLGFHTILALLVAWLFRLNRVAVLPGVFVTNPWSIIPVYTFCTWVGALILRVNIKLPEINWKHLSLNSLMVDFGGLAMPFFVGSLAVASVTALLCYVAVRITASRSAQ